VWNDRELGSGERGTAAAELGAPVMAEGWGARATERRAEPV
jgi:hypothetical protein